MKRFLIAGVALGLSVSVLADVTVVCKSTGYTANPDNFHSIVTQVKTSAFLIDGEGIHLGDVVYPPSNPDKVGLKGLAATYSQPKLDKIVYLYETDDGNPEIGISRIEDSSDTVFADKTLYSNCTFEPNKGKGHGAATTAFDVETGRSKVVQTSWRF
jgi:hypothetical protein